MAVHLYEAERLEEPSMVHDDTTYMDDEGLPYVDLAEDGECESVTPVDGAPGGRMWGFGEEAWGGWSAVE